MVIEDIEQMSFRQMNKKIKKAAAEGREHVEFKDVNGERYIAAGVDKPIQIDLYGTPGNDLGMFMNGPNINVYGNASDGVGNTMAGGTIVIHGDARDVLGYAMRGGRVYVKGDIGYRAGIHMKAWKEQPVVVVGGTAGDFLGEYMAGGTMIILNKECQPIGSQIGTGMHGGTIYIRGTLNWENLGAGVKHEPADRMDLMDIEPYIEDFCHHFNLNPSDYTCDDFTKIIPRSSRPYAKTYAHDENGD